MVKKKTNMKNSHVFKEFVMPENNKLLNNTQSNEHLNSFSDKDFKEVLDLYNAIIEGKIELNPKEKNEIINELNFIIKHFELSQNTNVSKNNFNEKGLKRNFNKNSNFDYINDNSSKISSVGYEGDYDELIKIESGEKFLTNGENDVVVNDKDTTTYEEEIVEEDTTTSERIDVVEDDFSNNLSVDDALTELIDDYSNEVAIIVKNLFMEFKVSKDKIDTLKEYFIRTVKRNKSGSKKIIVLDNLSFEIPKGDRVGIIGFNGAGKSTLLKVLSGVYDATGGMIETKGKIAPLLELGAGFDPNYTGRENIFLNGAFLGYSEDFLKEKYDEIVEFSELGDAINYPVKTYSSGMRAKLGFSIATIVEPDILILDEILSVGDIRFRKKSADKIRSLINSGITVLLVSHSVGQIRDLCNKAIWIDEGKLKMYGEVNEVCDAYVKAASNASRDQLENIQLN